MTVAELRTLLGNDVLLLKCKPGTKKPLGEWGHLTVASMTPAYLAKLEGGNIGVALGKVSGDLVALDVDDDDLVEPFLKANPFLNDTLQTHGARGRVFWFRMVGAYPSKTVKFKTGSGKEVGEWRAGKNSQSIIQGTHPDTGNPYQVVNKTTPLAANFTDIVWPSEISNPPTLIFQPTANVTEKTELLSDGDTEAISVSPSAPSLLSSPSLCFKVESIEHAVVLATPDRVHQNNDHLFTLARAVLNLEIQNGKFSPRQLRGVFAQWFKHASQFLDPNQTRDDYMTEFMNAYASAKVPLGAGVIAQAWKYAQEKPLPPEAVELFGDQRLRIVVALCRELQIVAGSEPFYLSARTLQGLLKQDGHATAARWLRSLCVMEILTETEKGNGNRASRYRYQLPITA